MPRYASPQAARTSTCLRFFRSQPLLHLRLLFRKHSYSNATIPYNVNMMMEMRNSAEKLEEAIPVPNAANHCTVVRNASASFGTSSLAPFSVLVVHPISIPSIGFYSLSPPQPHLETS